MNWFVVALICVLAISGRAEESQPENGSSSQPIMIPPPPLPSSEQPIPMNDKYFSRCARFTMLDDQVVAVDPNSPRMITMDAWPQLVFQAADGEHTVSELIDRLGQHYEGGTPAGLDKQVTEIIEELAKEGIVRIHDQPEKLPPEFAQPSLKPAPQ